MKSNEDSITIEETPVGTIPNWLFDHFINQAIDPRPISNGGPSKILTIYANENSRRQQMSMLSDIGFAFDRTLHHTLESLKSSLMADLRIPRKISLGPSFDLVLHNFCSERASNLSFPLINPLPNMHWGEGKTTALSELHTFLSKESSADSWDGPGIHSFIEILRDIESKTGGTHPDFLTSKILEGIELVGTPFTLLDIDGIIILDHASPINKSDQELLSALSKIRPIHQLTYPGSYRLGFHGFQLVDDFPITDPDDLPKWIPRHDISNHKDAPTVDRVFVNREEQSFEASISIARGFLSEESNSTVLIIDPSFEENQSRWNKIIHDLGLPISGLKNPITHSPLGHWLHELANIGNGSNSFSMEKLRLLAVQESLSPFSPFHNEDSTSGISPRPDIELLSQIARSEHILGGPGALERWMEALCRPSKKDEKGPSRESTQWWMIALASSILPLLEKTDRALLSDQRLLTGCHSGKLLEVPNSPSTGDEWLVRTVQQIDTVMSVDSLDGNTIPISSIINAITTEHESLRSLQSSVGQPHPTGGSEWVSELSSILKTASLPVPISGISSRLKVMAPKDALGCNSDIAILANTSAPSWNLRSPKIPFIGEMERHKFELLRPDVPITRARHHIYHILNCCSKVILIDPSLDKSTPLAPPLEEILDYCTPPVHFDPNSEENLGPRDIKQLDGVLLRNMKNSSNPPLNPSAITIPLDVELQRDRERRQPSKADSEGYLPAEYRNRVILFDYDDLTRKTPEGVDNPRNSTRWPVIGATSSDGKNSVTIDPRPFTPLPSGSVVSDSRHGHSDGANQEIQLWSPSRLQEWAKCPRRGWLSRGLRIRDEETQSEDLDPRIHGDLLHQVHHDLICEVLGMQEQVERDISGALDGHFPTNLADSGLEEQEIMQKALEILDKLAPWLERSDGVSTFRLRMLTGMSHSEWKDWLANPVKAPLGGRIGAMIRSEMQLSDSMPIALEWEISNGSETGSEISLNQNETSPNQIELPSIMINGKIDRVDIIPFDKEGNEWLDDGGANEIAPLRLFETNDWKPRRRVIIRDLKTSEKKPSDRNKEGLLNELQLAIYSRAWEINHPGDLVVGAGISTIGHSTEHLVEPSGNHRSELESLSVGTTTSLTSRLHRFPDESTDPKSDPFRAWMAQRLSVALGVAHGAVEGRVHPTPSKSACRYCPVSSICAVKMEDDY